MSSLGTVEQKLPPGFRFHPRDEELICDYLLKWVTGCAHQSPFLIQVDLNKCEPWDIPESACVGGKEWYFYSQRDRKYATGMRTNRATASGYWKATGKDRPIFRQESLVGMRKTLVFYQGRAPKGKKTDWVMHEFRLEGPICGGVPSPAEEDWVLCRLFHKTTPEEAGKQETESCAQEDSHNPFLPPFMQIAFDQTNQHYLKQVSCFSIVNPNPTLADTCPTMPENLPTRSTIPGVGGMLPSHGIYDSSNPANNYAINPSAWDQNVLRAVLNSHLATSKVESDYDHNYCSSSGMKGSPSRGEGSSDSHLSEVGLPSMWNLHGPTHRF